MTDLFRIANQVFDCERFHEHIYLSLCHQLVVYKVCACVLSVDLPQQSDGWQLPRAHIDFLLQYFTLSLSCLTM